MVGGHVSLMLRSKTTIVQVVGYFSYSPLWAEQSADLKHPMCCGAPLLVHIFLGDPRPVLIKGNPYQAGSNGVSKLT